VEGWKRFVGVVAVLVCLALTGATGCREESGPRETLAAVTALPAGTLPAIPDRLPRTLELGMANADGTVASMVETAPFGYRYQYLAGPADAGWTKWSHAWLRADREYVPEYIFESEEQGLVSVFTYYVLLQSVEGEGSESERILRGLADGETMDTYFRVLRSFFEQAGEERGTVILHVEPDLWGFAQAEAGDPGAIPVAMEDLDIEGLDRLPPTLAGFAQAIVKLRDEYAPNVLLGWHASTWANVDDFIYDDPPDEVVVERAGETAAFYRALGARFDLLFAEFSDRDAAFKEFEYGDGGTSWFDEGDFARHALWLKELVAGTAMRAVLWQIPYGNTQMRSLDNTPNHYQDNRVEWLLEDRGDGHLETYVDAGVIALLFGRGADGATDASDAAHDGVTNPGPVNGNEVFATSADDDGGLFRALAKLYYQAGALPLP
jgi:hypothetical protein